MQILFAMVMPLYVRVLKLTYILQCAASQLHLYQRIWAFAGVEVPIPLNWIEHTLTFRQLFLHQAVEMGSMILMQQMLVVVVIVALPDTALLRR